MLRDQQLQGDAIKSTKTRRRPIGDTHEAEFIAT
jgi:hypothetical protein